MTNLLIFLTTNEDRRVYLIRNVQDETAKKVCWFHGRVKVESDMDTAVRHKYKQLVKYLQEHKEDRIFDSISECGTIEPISLGPGLAAAPYTLVVIGL